MGEGWCLVLTTSDILTKHGPMRVINEDVWISRSLRELGEHSQSEINMMQLVLGLLSQGWYDGVVVDAGAYIGDTTIPLSRLCKQVYAFEPHAETREILKHNLDINHITNVEILPYALGDEPSLVKYNSVNLQDLDGELLPSPGGTQFGVSDGDCEARMESLDSLGLRPDFVKADIEGMEIPMLAGSINLIKSEHPVFFLEYDTVIQSEMRPLPECLELLGYKSYPMSFSMWNPDNFNKCQVNTFGSTVSKMMLGMPAPFGKCQVSVS